MDFLVGDTDRNSGQFGQCDAVDIAAFLTAMAGKGPVANELVGAATAMRQFCPLRRRAIGGYQAPQASNLRGRSGGACPNISRARG